MEYLLIWDIDGTLVHTQGAGGKAMDRAFLKLHGIEEGFRDIDMAGGLDPVILRDALAQYMLSNENNSEFFSLYCKYLSYELEKLASSIIIPGIAALFDVLGTMQGFYNVLGTGNIEKGARIKLSLNNLNRFFPTGGFADGETERWQVIKKAVDNSCSLFNKTFDSTNTYVIGDTPKDIACGKKLNLKTIGVATGRHTAEDLQKCNPDHVFENLTDIDAFLNILNPVTETGK